ncbi:MAG: sterol desaturase family protein [Myxococcota bacterium]|nr:sterol desaturase family protein [Myxococcales bacterium]
MTESLAARAVRLGAYPCVLLASVGGAAAWIASGGEPDVATTAVGFGLVPVCFALERAFPASPRWRSDPREMGADALHMVLSNAVPMALLRALLLGALVAATAPIAERFGAGLWPAHASLGAQFALALGLAELVNYALHRAYHETRLWPLHAVHHCSPRMYFGISVRKHPLQALLTYGGRFSVLWGLGATPQALAMYAVFVSANSYLQHANVRMTTGPLGLLLATPELHREHHAKPIERHDRNYGDSLIVFDRLFGTFRAPEPSGVPSDDIGLPGIEVPQTFAAHWRLPFAWRRLHAEASGASPGAGVPAPAERR